MRTFIITTLLLTACTEEQELDLGNVDQEVQSPNGLSLNGKSLNGKSLNGVSLNGISLNGRSLNGVSLNGTQLSGDAGALGGDALAGATMVGRLSDGSTTQLRINSVTQLAVPNDDVWAYDISYQLANGTWAAVCDAGLAAIPLRGTWSYAAGVPGGGSWTDSDDAITLACRGNALAKCVELGYKPWQSAALRDDHQACTRMLRADYCGDGTPATFNGWHLDVADVQSIQTPTPGLTGWKFEATWSASGAVCMSSYRALDLIASSAPACVQQRMSSSCTAAFTNGAVLQNSFDPWSLSVALADAYTKYPSADLLAAITEINTVATAARPADVAEAVSKAVASIEKTTKYGVPSVFATALMRRYTDLIRAMLVAEIDRAANSNVSGASSARLILVAGDTLILLGDYPKGIAKFSKGFLTL